MKEGTKIVDHLYIFNTLMCQLTSMDVKIEDEDKEVMLLCPFLKYWDHLVTSISFSKIYNLDFGYVLGALLSKDMLRKPSIETSRPKAMVARGWSIEKGNYLRVISISKSKGRKGEGKCWYCKKLGYVKKDCWKRK